MPAPDEARPFEAPQHRGPAQHRHRGAPAGPRSTCSCATVSSTPASLSHPRSCPPNPRRPRSAAGRTRSSASTTSPGPIVHVPAPARAGLDSRPGPWLTSAGPHSRCPTHHRSACRTVPPIQNPPRPLEDPSRPLQAFSHVPFRPSLTSPSGCRGPRRYTTSYEHSPRGRPASLRGAGRPRGAPRSRRRAPGPPQPATP